MPRENYIPIDCNTVQRQDITSILVFPATPKLDYYSHKSRILEL